MVEKHPDELKELQEETVIQDSEFNPETEVQGVPELETSEKTEELTLESDISEEAEEPIQKQETSEMPEEPAQEPEASEEPGESAQASEISEEAEEPTQEPITSEEPEEEVQVTQVVKKKSLSQKIVSGVCIFLCILLLPILIANIVIIVKGSLHPDEIPTVAGIAPMAVITDSMNTKDADAIKAGDLVVTKSVDPDTLKVGDIIMYKSGNSAVIHRIIAYDEENKTYTTKGDANNTEDMEPVEQKNIIGKYVFKISNLGDFVLFSKTPLGMGVCIGIPLLLLFGYDFLANFLDKRRQKREAIQS